MVITRLLYHKSPRLVNTPFSAKTAGADGARLGASVLDDGGHLRDGLH